jgi:hypothetical protein
MSTAALAIGASLYHDPASGRRASTAAAEPQNYGRRATDFRRRREDWPVVHVTPALLASAVPIAVVLNPLPPWGTSDTSDSRDGVLQTPALTSVKRRRAPSAQSTFSQILIVAAHRRQSIISSCPKKQPGSGAWSAFSLHTPLPAALGTTASNGKLMRQP